MWQRPGRTGLGTTERGLRQWAPRKEMWPDESLASGAREEIVFRLAAGFAGRVSRDCLPGRDLRFWRAGGVTSGDGCDSRRTVFCPGGDRGGCRDRRIIYGRRVDFAGCGGAGALVRTELAESGFAAQISVRSARAALAHAAPVSLEYRQWKP